MPFPTEQTINHKSLEHFDFDSFGQFPMHVHANGINYKDGVNVILDMMQQNNSDLDAKKVIINKLNLPCKKYTEHHDIHFIIPKDE